MPQLVAKLKNKTTAYSASLRPRVLDVVVNAGLYYVNVSGFNGAITDASHWFPWPVGTGGGGGGTPVEVDKGASDITGSDPDFQLDLTAASMPDFPSGISIYVDLDGTGDWQPTSGPIYNPVTKIMHGLNNPVTYPSMQIKIKAI